MKNKLPMKRDYSGKHLSRKTHKVLLVVNIVLFLAAATLAGGNLYYKETVGTVAMLLVMIVAAGNAIRSGLFLKNNQK